MGLLSGRCRLHFFQAAYDTNELAVTMARAFDDGQEARALIFGSWGDLYITNLTTTAIFHCDLGVCTLDGLQMGSA